MDKNKCPKWETIKKIWKYTEKNVSEHNALKNIFRVKKSVTILFLFSRQKI
jgi:ActR/RegA family two-component response regulator